MTTRKTTNGYKVSVDTDERLEKFDFYEDVKVCFKDVLRGYNLDKITTDFSLDDLEVDYLLGKINKEELKEERYRHNEEYFDKLDEYKEKYDVVGLSINEHTQFAIGYGDDGVMLVEKDTSTEFVKVLIDELEAWFNGWVYCVNIYEPQKFINESGNGEDLIHWEFVDGQSGYFDPQDALVNLPDYVGEIIKESESEHWEEFEWC